MKIYDILKRENEGKIYTSRLLRVAIMIEIFSDGDVVAVIDASDYRDIPIPSLLEDEFSLKSILDAEFVELIQEVE